LSSIEWWTGKKRIYRKEREQHKNGGVHTPEDGSIRVGSVAGGDEENAGIVRRAGKRFFGA
jgi:hypothetical protein